MKVEENLQEKLLDHPQEKDLGEIGQGDQKNEKVKLEYFSKKRFIFGDNFFQVLFFTWVSPLLHYGFRFTLDQSAIPYLRENDKPKMDFTKLLENFNRNVRNNKSKREGLTLTKTLFKSFKKQFLTVFIFALFITTIQMYSPILSHNIIEYIAIGERDLQTGLYYFLSIFGLTLSLAIFQTFFYYFFAVLGYNLSNTLSLVIYNKVLKYPIITEKQFSIGDIINYSQVDSQRLTYLGFQLVALLYTPIQIIFSLFLLYIYIGPSFFAGMGVMIILMLSTLILSKIAVKSNDKLLKAKDERMKVTQQILQIIKYIKLNVLQKYFFQKLNAKRQTELKFIKKVNLCYVATILVYWVCPPMIVSSTFLVFTSLGNQITAAKAFFTIIIFNILQVPIRLLPSAISSIIQIWSSLKRIQKFLIAQEIQSGYIEKYDKVNEDAYSIVIQQGSFLWGKEKDKEKQDKQKQGKEKQKQDSNSAQDEKSQSITKNATEIRDSSRSQISQELLKESLISQKQSDQNSQQQQKYIKVLHDIQVKIPSKSVNMIIGDIGSGKSSLLYAILNQMTPQPGKNPKVKIFGQIAYCPQKPWIMAGTVKDNITFCKPYNEKKFNQAVHYACLEDDLKILNKGIQTEIGQKGANLSGGQKARISLARALYSDKDIYLLDDILSAVDVHVGRFMMEETILQYLKGKTVIMPTHAIKYLEKADNIMIMDKGKIVQMGSFKQLSQSEELQQIIKVQQKKQQSEQQAQKKTKQQESILNELKLVKSQTKSKDKAFQQVNQQVQITDKIVQQLIMPEDHNKGEVSLDVYYDYIKLNGGPLFFFSVMFCMGTWMALSTLSNIQIERWCQDQEKPKFYLYLYLGFSITASVFSGMRAYILITSGIKQGRTLHKRMIKSLLYASITQFYNRVPIGRILNRLSKDLRQIDESLGFSVGGTLMCFCSMTASLVMCVYASTFFVLIPIFIVGIICKFFLRYYLKSQRECVRLQNISTSPIVSGFTSAVNGVGTIRSYNLSTQFLNQQIDRVDKNKRMRMARQGMESWFSIRLALFSFMINMSSLAYCVLYNNENASLAGLLLTYANFLSDDILSFAFSFANLQLKMISVQRVLTFSKLQPQTGYKQYCSDWRTKQEGFDIKAIPQGEIQFVNYSARYRETLPLTLKNISLHIKPGQKVGLVGRTGAGKSTLINCLVRILDSCQGKLLINKKQIRQYNLKDLRSCITMIEQEPTLIKGSFRQNLDPSHTYTEQEINKILGECNLDQMVKLKGGLDSIVTNENLSVGEKQLLCICRAFLKKSQIILIDEATANIDVKNDKIIQEVLGKAFKNSTVITIAHRLSTLQNCDKIIVLGEGKVVQWGGAEQLKNKKGGVYYKMCQENDKSYLS